MPLIIMQWYVCCVGTDQGAEMHHALIICGRGKVVAAMQAKPDCDGPTSAQPRSRLDTYIGRFDEIE